MPTPDVVTRPRTSGRGARALRHCVEAMGNTSRRNIYFSALAIPGHLVMALSKGMVLLVSFSAFVTATVLFTLGLAVIKTLVISAYRRATYQDRADAIPRAYRVSGTIVVALSALWLVSCLPLALGGELSGTYDPHAAVLIAALAFVELGFSVHGWLSSRRRKDPLMEAIKLSNLASGLVLLVLAQTALLSMTEATDRSTANGWFGVGVGAVSAGIGVYMIMRSRRPVRV